MYKNEWFSDEESETEISEGNFNFLNIDYFLDLSTERKNMIRKIRFHRSGDYYSRKRSFSKTTADQFYSNMISVIKMFPKVTHLIIKNFHEFEDEHFVQLGITFLENLELLHLIQNILLTGATFVRIANNCCYLNNFHFMCKFDEINVLKDDEEEIDCHYCIGTEYLALLLRRNEKLYNLGLMLKNLKKEAIDAIAKSNQITMLELDVSGYIKSVAFMSALFELLLLPDISYVKVVIGSGLVVHLEENKLFFECPDHFGYNFDFACSTSLQMCKIRLQSIELVGCLDLTNYSLSSIANSHKLSIHTIILSRCGIKFNNLGIKSLTDYCLDLKFILVVEGAKILGKYGSCTIQNDVVLCLVGKDGYCDRVKIKKLAAQGKMSQDNLEYLLELRSLLSVEDGHELDWSDSTTEGSDVESHQGNGKKICK
jgi:hypothetical protein